MIVTERITMCDNHINDLNEELKEAKGAKRTEKMNELEWWLDMKEKAIKQAVAAKALEEQKSDPVAEANKVFANVPIIGIFGSASDMLFKFMDISARRTMHANELQQKREMFDDMMVYSSKGELPDRELQKFIKL